jgi:hypothetical protein
MNSGYYLGTFSPLRKTAEFISGITDDDHRVQERECLCLP